MVESAAKVAGRVLLVEDTPLNQKLEKTMLEYCGCQVDVAESGREALHLFDRNRYAVIFMDCQMPGMDGYTTTGAIRERESRGAQEGAAAATPIVALTAYAMEGDREKCLQAGMDDYLSKPFGMEALTAMVQRWMVSRPAAGGRRPREAGGDPEAGGEASLPVDRAPLDRLASLQPAGGNEALRRIMALYFDQSEGLIERLRGAVKGNDSAALEAAAHVLKSSSASLGAAPLAALCRELEAMGRSGSLVGAGEVLDSLEREYPQVRAFLERYRDALA